jgi:hemerythrin
MELVQWDEETMGTGVEMLDREHRTLIEMLNLLIEATVAGRGPAEVRNTMKFLGEYAVYHFRNEEGIMDRCRCPVAQQNKDAHAKFLNEYRELAHRFETEGPTEEFIADVQKKIVNWLSMHIRGCDTQLRKCVVTPSS